MSPDLPLRLALGLLLSALVSLLAMRRGSLSPGGALGAVVTGTLVFGCGGICAGLLMVAFFVSSSALSQYRHGSARKREAAMAFDKTGRRDLGQALANGALPAILAVAYSAFERDTSALSLMIYAGLLGALATVNADTWATEVGVLSDKPPRLITDLRRTVATGTSGGVTALGTRTALFGAAFISIAFGVLTFVDGMLVSAALRSPWLNAVFFGPLHVDWYGLAILGIVVFVLSGTLGGLAGALFDSVLGATVQAIYYSDKRGKETERPIDPDGTPNRRLRGAAWLNNDWVNFISSGAGAGVAMLLFAGLSALFAGLTP